MCISKSAAGPKLVEKDLPRPAAGAAEVTIRVRAAGVTGLAEGDAVFGMNDWFADGALAEYCVTRPEWVAAKPRRLSDEEAATVSGGALTAWQGPTRRCYASSSGSSITVAMEAKPQFRSRAPLRRNRTHVTRRKLGSS